MAVPDVSSGFVRFPADLERRKLALLLDVGECAEFERVVRELGEEFPPSWLAHFVVEGNLTRFLEYFPHHAGLVPSLAPRRCSQGAQRVIVNGRGEVKPCFFLEPIGHIAESDAGDFYTSEKARRFRQTFDPGTNATCRRCAQFLDWRF